MKTCVIIPSRMGSTRLPGKPLADIQGVPMICRVWDCARASSVASIVVACDDEKIKTAVEAHGGQAVLTDSELPSGSDRIWQALQRMMAQGMEKPDVIINVQGDEPLMPAELIDQAVSVFEENDWADVVTFAHVIDKESEMKDPSMVKIAMDSRNCAHYFSRAPIPHGADKMNRHIGFYAYKYDALEAFVAAQPTYLEETEKLEQLRGLDLGLKYCVAMTHYEPIGVDTPADLERVNALLAK